ncbi:ImmA/IrrE family metallo-endopeptidase [Mesorhizobium amorphae]|uniref:ImmA/IrrE family metallo-endopeptidase n=1 Tax=Mesorhizobium amorphae TaxID=71433 RepID=UPI003ECEA951
MAASAQKRQELPINRNVLRWARVRHHRTHEEAAKSVGVTPEKVVAWEEGAAKPTVLQARKLAAVYERPFLEFFSREIPNIPEPVLVPDFRLHRAAPQPVENFELLEIQRWAEEQRLNALDLFDILGERPRTFPGDLYATPHDDVEELSMRLRERMEFPIHVQLDLKSDKRYTLPKIVRHRLEALGIMVLKTNALASFRARGLCIFNDPLPVVVFGGEAPSAQAFTLAHELAHVLLKQSAISGPPPAADSSRPAQIEKWCNDFAAAFLVPEKALRQSLKMPDKPRPDISDSQLAALANAFAISQHAMLIRLVRLGYVEARYYWDVKRAHFIAMEAAYKGKGRSLYYGSRYRSARGDLYTGLVLEAWNTRRITNHNAAEFMGIKNISHLDAIRENFGK